MDFTHATLRACSSLYTVSEPILSREALRLRTQSGEGWYTFGEVHLLAEVGWDECLAAFERFAGLQPKPRWRARLTAGWPAPGQPAGQCGQPNSPCA